MQIVSLLVNQLLIETVLHLSLLHHLKRLLDIMSRADVWLATWDAMGWIVRRGVVMLLATHGGILGFELAHNCTFRSLVKA